MIDIRQLQEHEAIDAIALSDKVFRDQDTKSMGDAFPSIFSKDMIGHSFGAFVNGELVSFMGLVPSVVRIGEAKLNVHSLGSVCTAKTHRGQGIASQMLEHVFNYLKTSDTALLLVSGDRSLYTRANCCHFGKVKHFIVKKEEVVRTESDSIREMKTADILGIHRVAQERMVAYEQSVLDLKTMLHAEAYASCIKQSHKTMVYEKEGKVSSFLVVGIPTIHNEVQKATAIEWAGSPTEIVQLMTRILNDHKIEELDVHVPWYDQELANELKGSSYTSEQNQGTIYIVNPERIVSQLQPYLNDNDLVNFKMVNHEHVQVNAFDKTMTMHIKEFISFLFDSKIEHPEVTSLQHASRGLFPIPFPYTAGLNYV